MVGVGDGQLVDVTVDVVVAVLVAVLVMVNVRRRTDIDVVVDGII